MPLPALKWLPSPNYSNRSEKIALVVCHDCEGSYKGSIATFLDAHRPNPVSAHLVLREDGKEATQMVDFSKKAWHACNFNSESIGVEMAGYEARGYADSEWAAEANIVAYLLHRYDLPVRWAENGEGAGFCRHLDLGRAGGGHMDPTRDPQVWAGFCARVKAAYDAKDFGDALPWGRE
jgi:N-acetylmuramoyl-L-alanine amidase